MQQVSEAYKQSIREDLRNRGYIMVVFGGGNRKANINASIGDMPLAAYSQPERVLSNGNDDFVYATLEENFCKVDGSQHFMPSSSPYWEYSLISESMVSEGPVQVVINFSVTIGDLGAIKINFGENYPVDFDISDGTSIYEYRNNNQRNFLSEDSFADVDQLTMTFYRMKSEQSRLRIYSITFGDSLTFYNDSVIDSLLEKRTSLISEDLPQIDLSVTLKNLDRFFNLDNPRSTLDYTDPGQSVDVYYGYELPDGDVEWIQGAHLFCVDWEADDLSATVKCQDALRAMNSEYYKGTYTGAGVSLYNLAAAVLQDAGISDFELDDSLKTIYSKSPLPRLEHRQLLQLIANAGCCILRVSRTGTIEIVSAEIDHTLSSNGEMWYSQLENIDDATAKDEYAIFAQDYIKVDGSMFFLSTLAADLTKYRGWISAAISDENGEFVTNPAISVDLRKQGNYRLEINFGSGSLPSGMIVRGMLNGTETESYTVSEITRRLSVDHGFTGIDGLVIEFTGTAVPYNPIIVDSLTVGEGDGFKLTRNDMMSLPRCKKTETIKEITIPYYLYNQGSQSELVNEQITAAAGEILTYYFDAPCHSYGTSTSGAVILESGSYYVKVYFSSAGSYSLVILGYKYEIAEQYITVQVHQRGKSIKWENPLITSPEMAFALGEWLKDYYLHDIDYSYEIRGYPELDPGDVIRQENEFVDEINVKISSVSLGFNGGFTGSIVTRRTEA